MISVCIATYNGESYIGEQIRSILFQLSENDEIVVSDNGSTDSTIEILESLGDQRVKIFNCSSRGVVNNFENSLKYARGDYIFLSDQDDVWIDGKVSTMIRLLSEFELVMSDGYVVDKSLRITGCSIYGSTKPRLGVINNLIRNSFTGCCMAFNRRVLNAALPFHRLLPMHDWWLGLVAQSVGNVKIIDDKLILYRRHDFNVSTLSSPSNKTFFQKIHVRILIVGLFILWRLFHFRASLKV
jgi:glycosyltransferase involved in cell wall biosynthesis